MKEKMRHVLGFLGLVEDDYGDYSSVSPARPFSDQPVREEEYGAPRTFNRTPTPARPPAPAPVRTSSISVLDGSGEGPRARLAPQGGVRGIAPLAPERDVAIFLPYSYDEARRITELLRANRPVVLNTSEVDPSVSRRLVDFAAGTAWALNARVERVVNGSVYFVLPPGVTVGHDVRERLAASNYRSLDPA